MAKYALTSTPLPKASSSFRLPKTSMAHAESGGMQARTTASAYGKLPRMGSSKTGVPMQKAPSQ